MFNNGVSYKLITDAQISMIHEKALDILAHTGVKFDSEEALQVLLKHGAEVDFKRQIAKMPASLVMEALKTAPEFIPIYDREGNPVVTLGGDQANFAPGSAPMNFMEADGKTVRPAKAEDLVDISRVTDALEHILFQSSSVVLNDIPQNMGDCYRLYLLLKNSPKPIISGAFSVEGITRMREMLAVVRGSYEELESKPLAVFDICPSPPLKWTHISSQNIIDCARYGLPLETVSVPMPGAVAPATLAGCVLLHTVETLSGIVLAQCVKPGAPVVYGGAPMYFDMRQSTTSLNSIETSLISIAYAQMGKYYGLPTHTYAGLSDAKVSDAQAGLESGMSALLALIGGINVISGVGVMEFCNTFSLEKLVIDHEICGQALRLERGLNCSEEALAADLIAELGPGGDFLSTEHTLKWFRREPYFPSPIIDRRMRITWEETGALTAFDQAAARVRNILSSKPARLLDSERSRHLDEATKKIMQELNIENLPFGPQ